MTQPSFRNLPSKYLNHSVIAAATNFFVNPLLRDGMFWIHINNITNIRTPTCFTRSSPETFFPKNTLWRSVSQRGPPATAAHKVPLRRTFAVVSGHPCGLWGMRMRHLSDGHWEACTGSEVFLGFRTSSCSQKKNDVFFVGCEKKTRLLYLTLNS